MKRIILVFAILVSVTGYFMLGHSRATKPAVPIKSTISLSAMEQKIQTVINNNPQVDTSVSLVDLDTGSHLHFGVTDTFEGASTTKLITASEYLHDVENGTETMSKDLGGETGSQALELMIVNSDNTAWQLLVSEMGEDQLASYAQSIGINDFDVSDNTLTSDDIALLLQKLYTGQLLNKSDTSLLLSYMKRANDAEYIPPAIPKGDTVYHKAGLLDDRAHDAAIITDGNHAFVVVVFTNGHGTYNTPNRINMLQTIAKASIAHYLGL